MGYIKKFNVKLNQVYQEEKTSTFIHNGDEYNLNALLRYTHNLPIIQLPVSKLKWVLEYSDIDTKRVKLADLNYPIIVTKEYDKWIVLDGAHRLTKALKNKVKTINVVVASSEMLRKCKMSSLEYNKLAKNKKKAELIIKPKVTVISNDDYDYDDF